MAPCRDIDFTGDVFRRSHGSDPGYYVWFGMWKGPFDSEAMATSAYKEWAAEARAS